MLIPSSELDAGPSFVPLVSLWISTGVRGSRFAWERNSRDTARHRQYILDNVYTFVSCIVYILNIAILRHIYTGFVKTFHASHNLIPHIPQS